VAIGAPWVGTPVHGSTAGTSVTLDFTGATVGEWCYAAVALADSQASTPTAPSGWTVVVQGSEGTTGAASSRLVLYRRKKQAGDTTQAFAWATSCKYESLPWSWPGLDPTTPDEGAAYASHTSTANFVTGSVTPTSTDRWIGMVAGARGTTSLETFTPDAAMTERSDSNHGGANPFVAVELADTNTAVTQAGHTYTAVCSVADGHGGTIALALIPATAATVTGSASLTATGTLTASRVAAGVRLRRPDRHRQPRRDRRQHRARDRTPSPGPRRSLPPASRPPSARPHSPPQERSPPAASRPASPPRRSPVPARSRPPRPPARPAASASPTGQTPA
jgi:hypothetical protein